jgi:hypothetical protein
MGAEEVDIEVRILITRQEYSVLGVGIEINYCG